MGWSMAWLYIFCIHLCCQPHSRGIKSLGNHKNTSMGSIATIQGLQCFPFISPQSCIHVVKLGALIFYIKLVQLFLKWVGQTIDLQTQGYGTPFLFNNQLKLNLCVSAQCQLFSQIWIGRDCTWIHAWWPYKAPVHITQQNIISKVTICKKDHHGKNIQNWVN